ncbi:MAG: 3-phosphoshikimate 1-carboxyvinyltransferase [Oscillospiraceae bacterium]|nr:3-phosphoshikimate 1-carboxyvinyltransferase [Oscillospiraceae bacterium]
MDITLTPSRLSGKVKIPSSKSLSHRNIIAASLADGISVVRGITSSVDIDATCRCMEQLGATITHEGSTYTVKGISEAPEKAYCDCAESGSTLRFVIPIAAALGTQTTFDGHGKLPTRPITPYIREFARFGVTFDKTGRLPITMTGQLRGGEYELEGDISSQFVTGLLFALPLLGADSKIKMLSKLQSRPYAQLTISTLRAFGVDIDCIGDDFSVKGGQRFSPSEIDTEGDYSQAAFFLVANALGSDIIVEGLRQDSAQGDKEIINIIKGCGSEMSPFEADVSDIPDLVPVLAVLASACHGKSRIYNASRLRIKESDRLESVCAMINALGGKAVTGSDYMEIYHTDRFTGGTVDACNDHRIVMAAAVASCYSDSPVTIKGAEAVNKSYPTFFDDMRSLGCIC